MKTKSILTVSVISLLVLFSLEASAQKIERKELYTASIGTRPISTVDVREIDFQPGQMTGLHRHPCPVISYVVTGTIRFQVRGQKMQIIHAGQVCYELANAIIEHFDNASNRAPAKFIPCYLLNGQKELIEMLPARSSPRRTK